MVQDLSAFRRLRSRSMATSSLVDRRLAAEQSIEHGNWAFLKLLQSHRISQKCSKDLTINFQPCRKLPKLASTLVAQSQTCLSHSVDSFEEIAALGPYDSSMEVADLLISSNFRPSILGIDVRIWLRLTSIESYCPLMVHTQAHSHI